HLREGRRRPRIQASERSLKAHDAGEGLRAQSDPSAEDAVQMASAHPASFGQIGDLYPTLAVFEKLNAEQDALIDWLVGEPRADESLEDVEAIFVGGRGGEAAFQLRRIGDAPFRQPLAAFGQV